MDSAASLIALRHQPSGRRHATRGPRRNRRTARVRTSPLDLALYVAVGVTVLLVVLTIGTAGPANPAVPGWRAVLVDDNATLWDLARAHPVEGLGTAQTVALIQERNGLATGTIAAGQRLDVPQPVVGSSTASRW